MGRYEVATISRGVMRIVSALRDLAAITIFVAQCTAETVYMNEVTASIEFLILVGGRLDLGTRVRVGNRSWNADVQHKNTREEKNNGVYP